MNLCPYCPFPKGHEFGAADNLVVCSRHLRESLDPVKRERRRIGEVALLVFAVVCGLIVVASLGAGLGAAIATWQVVRAALH